MNRKEPSQITVAFRKRRAALWEVTLDEFDTLQTIIEVLEYNWANKISLFTFRDKWSYCLHVWPGDVGGEFYGPSFSLCDPFPDRQSAIENAVEKMQITYKKSQRAEAKKMLAWAFSLITPQQLRLL